MVGCKKFVIVMAVVLVLVAIYFHWRHFLFKLDWEYASSETSPGGMFTITHFRSRTEAGHAPYGDNLIIESWKSFPKPKSGETFFAGYCGNEFMYKWEGDKKIKIHCPGVTEREPIRTQAIVVHGINVEVTK